MLRQATVLLLAAAILVSAATAGRPKPVPPKVVVRTELVPASNDGFDSLDAAASLGGSIVSVAAVLLVRTAKSAS